MLSFIKFLTESFLVESYREQLIGALNKTKEMIAQAKIGRESDAGSRPYMEQMHTIPGFGKHRIHFTAKKRKDDVSGSFQLSPQKKRINPEEHTIVLYGAPGDSIKSTFDTISTTKGILGTMAHELAHSWQTNRQQEDNRLNRELGIPRSSGEPITSRMVTQKTLMKLKDIRKSLSPEQSEELNRITAELDDLKPTQEEMYNDYLNSDLERNARAIEQGVNIFYNYPRMFSKVSAEMPEATHDEVVQHVRRKFLERQRKREPTLNPKYQSKIAQRYAERYEAEHTKRMMIAIQHAEETHLPKLRHVKR